MLNVLDDNNKKFENYLFPTGDLSFDYKFDQLNYLK